MEAVEHSSGVSDARPIRRKRAGSIILLRMSLISRRDDVIAGQDALSLQPSSNMHLTVVGDPLPERIFRISILSYDWNCPKFITPS